MIQSFSRFDFIGVARYVPNAQRAGNLAKELAAAGIAGRATDFWDYDSPLKEREMSAFRRGAGIDCVGAYGCAMNHYRMWKTASGLGAKCALFLEDDVRFLKDGAVLEDVVASLPSDFDVALFDWFGGRAMREGGYADLASRPREGRWADMHGVNLVSCGCYALSVRGMDWLIRAFERSALYGKMRAADTYFRPGRLPEDLKAYCSFPHGAIQGTVADGVHATSKGYSAVGTSEEDYL